MKLLTIILIFIISLSAYSNSENLARDANNNPFLNGELNPKYEGQKIALAGQVLEIKPTKQKFPVYKLNLD